MSGYIADTSVFVAAEQRRGLGDPPPGEARISAITLAELELGVRRARGRRIRRLREETVDRARSFIALPFDEPSAERFAALVAGLRSSKRRAMVLDAQIAATALAHDLTVWTADSGFTELAEVEPDLRVELG